MANTIRYLRVSLLPACNFHCMYCRPVGSESGHPDSLTGPGQFEQAIRSLHRCGIRKVRFTGGEPTLYPSLVELIEFAKSLSPAVHTALTTNGSRLPRLAGRLKDAGLDSVNISLDTLNPRTFREITGRDDLDTVIHGIESARDLIPSVKLNTVVLNGVNSHEAEAMIRFADRNHVDIRFIEYMPTRDSQSQPAMYISGDELRRHLPFDFTAISSVHTGAARYYSAPDLRIRVGFIEAVSNPFCETCDRIRLTADGQLFGCLFSGQSFNLFDEMSDPHSDIAGKIDELIRARTNLGCSTKSDRLHHLPAFVVTGG